MQSRSYSPKSCSVPVYCSSPAPSSTLLLALLSGTLLILVFPSPQSCLCPAAQPGLFIFQIYLYCFRITFIIVPSASGKRDGGLPCSCRHQETGEKNTSSSANVFSLLARGASASFNFNQMSNKGGLVENKLSLIYGVSCKQESTSQFLCFLLMFSSCAGQGELPLISLL